MAEFPCYAVGNRSEGVYCNDNGIVFYSTFEAAKVSWQGWVKYSRTDYSVYYVTSKPAGRHGRTIGPEGRIVTEAIKGNLCVSIKYGIEFISYDKSVHEWKVCCSSSDHIQTQESNTIFAFDTYAEADAKRREYGREDWPIRVIKSIPKNLKDFPEDCVVVIGPVIEDTEVKHVSKPKIKYGIEYSEAKPSQWMLGGGIQSQLAAKNGDKIIAFDTYKEAEDYQFKIWRFLRFPIRAIRQIPDSYLSVDSVNEVVTGPVVDEAQPQIGLPMKLRQVVVVRRVTNEKGEITESVVGTPATDFSNETEENLKRVALAKALRADKDLPETEIVVLVGETPLK